MKSEADVIVHILRSNDPESVIKIYTADLAGLDVRYDDEAIGAAVYNLARRTARYAGHPVEAYLQNGIWIIKIKMDADGQAVVLRQRTESESYREPKHLYSPLDSAKNYWKGSKKMERGRGNDSLGAKGANLTRELAVIREKDAINLTAFEKLLPDLLKTDKGKFVAIFDGKVVGIDVDQLELMRKLPKNLRPAAYLMIREIIANQESEVITVNRPISGE